MTLSAPAMEATPPARTAPRYRPAPLRAARHSLARASLSFHTSPMLLAAACFAVGILDAHWVWHPPLLSLTGALLGLALTLFAIVHAPRVLLLPLIALWFAVGQFCALVAPVRMVSPRLAQLADGMERSVSGTVIALHDRRTEVRGSLYSSQQETEQTQQVDIALDHVEDFTADRDWQTPVEGGLRLTLYAPPGELLPRLGCGEHLILPVRLRLPDRYLDPGAWDYPAYLARHGMYVTASTDVGRFPAVDRSGRRPTVACLASEAQIWAGRQLDRVVAIDAAHPRIPKWLRLSEEDGGILSAMLFGDRMRLQHGMRSAFERTGSFHLLVVSGLHITIVIGLIFWLARRLRLSPFPATCLAIVLALPYAFLTGFAPPMQRALWLSAVYLISRIVYRERAALNAIGIAALGVLALDPPALFDASFQMTFLAVLIIAGVAAPLIEGTVAPYLRGLWLPLQISLDPYLPPRVAQLRVSLRMLTASLKSFAGPRWSWRIPFGVTRIALRFAEALVVAFIVELAMVLPMAVYFHRITLVALPANMIGLPLLAFLLPVALLTFLLGCIHPALALPAASVTAALLHAISSIIHLFGSLSVSGLRTPDPPVWSIFCYAGVWVAALWMVRLSAGMRRAAIALVFIGSVLVLWPAAPSVHPGQLEVTAIDVGQGDSLLIVSPDGKTLLVDAGGPIGGPRNSAPTFDVGEEVVSQYLWHRRFRRLDAVALTHAHSDHMGGMPAVLRNFHPRELWVGHNPLSPEYRALLALASEEDIPVERRTAGQRFPFGTAQVHILAPMPDYQPGAHATNNDSLVMRIRYRSTAVLLEGDAEAPVEEEMVTAGEPLAAGLLKVGHHGSSTSSTPAFLAAVHPAFAVISAGRNNPFHHPRVPVLDALGEAHMRVYRTDTLGISSFLLNGSTIEPLGVQPLR